MPQQYKSAKRKMKKPAMSHGNKPKMYGKPKMGVGNKEASRKARDAKVNAREASRKKDDYKIDEKYLGPKMYGKKPNAKFPDLSGDGKVTKKDILMGRGVIDKPKMLKNKRKDIAGKAMMGYAKPAMYGKPKGYVSDAQRKAVHASKADGGKGNPNKPKMYGKKK